MKFRFDFVQQHLYTFVHVCVLQVSCKTGYVVDNICLTYSGGNVIQHGGNGGWGHAILELTLQEDIVGVAFEPRWMFFAGTCVYNVILIVANRQTQRRRAWSARGGEIDMQRVGAYVTEVPGKVLKCVSGRAGWYLDQISCTWHSQ